MALNARKSDPSVLPFCPMGLAVDKACYLISCRDFLLYFMSLSFLIQSIVSPQYTSRPLFELYTGHSVKNFASGRVLENAEDLKVGKVEVSFREREQPQLTRWEICWFAFSVNSSEREKRKLRNQQGTKDTLS